MKTFIATTKNGIDVYVDIETSHAATHLKNHPELFDYMKEILSQYELVKDIARFQTNMGRIVGTMDLVETTGNDDVFYAKRPNREKYTRFVRNKNAIPTTSVTMELRKINNHEADVFTVFIGPFTSPFPYGKDDPNDEARRFWSTHALVTGNQEYLLETVTKECPW